MGVTWNTTGGCCCIPSSEGMGIETARTGTPASNTRVASPLRSSDGIPRTRGGEPLGFEESGNLQWDDQYAPPEWNYGRDDHPDVVFMELGG